MNVQVEDVTACPVCAGAFNGAKVTGNHLTYNGQTAYYHQCGTCGAWALSPRMTDAFTVAYYSGKYREYAPIGEKTWEIGRRRAELQIEQCARFFDGKYVLEVGCSVGHLLHRLTNLGYWVTGVDPDPNSAAAFHNIGHVPPLPYDVITMSHTLEHFNHPRAVLEYILANFTHPGTKIMIDVPNMGTCFEAGIFQVHHPVAFDLPALRWLMESLGCKVIFDCLHGDGEPEVNNLLTVSEVG